MFGGAGLRFLRWADGGSAVWVEAVVHAHGLCLFLFFVFGFVRWEAERSLPKQEELSRDRNQIGNLKNVLLLCYP